MTEANKRFDDSMTMEELLNSTPSIEQGKIVQGEVVSVDSKFAYLNIGGKVEGKVFLNEFDKTPEQGEKHDVLIKSSRLSEGMYQLSKRAVVQIEKWKNFEAWASAGNERVNGKLIKKLPNGAVVEFDGVTGFLPIKEAGDIRIKDDDSFSRSYEFKVIQIDLKKKNVILSRKMVVDEIKEKAWSEISSKYKEGDVVSGTVVSFADFGTFVSINGYEALLHNNDLSWSKGVKRKNILKIGDKGEFKILSMDLENRKIALGIKQMTADPWETIDKKYRAGDKVKGTVTTVTSFGIFAEIENGIEGLVSSGEISWIKKIVNPKELYKKDDVVSAVITDINKAERRISLSIKQAEVNPFVDYLSKNRVGSVVDSKVARIAPFGLFVNLANDIDALVHVSDLSWDDEKVDLASNYKPGDSLKVKILSANSDEMKISCGIKQLTRSPWEDVKEKFPPRSKVSGTVSSITSFGVFVKLDDKVEGLVHLSELSRNKIEDVNSVFKIGDSVNAVVLDVDVDKKKISLSIKGFDIMSEKEELSKVMGGNTSNTASIADLLKNKMEKAN
ncbi:MAG TPA: S1 RNA-binding domain-containing protein [Spirochaetota bacterium]|nr:S1 RNA-binding domain-containing protein [Spirochaetota bacterium]